MKEFYTAEDIAALKGPWVLNGKPVRLGVIGNPIAHSKSPQMQQAALDAVGVNAAYVRLLAGTEEGAFESLLAQLKDKGFIGVNVTVPFKKRAFLAAQHRDALAELSGAVNTLVWREDGLHGFNTDGPGFERAIAELTGGKKLADLSIVILGANGGAGSALACQCILSNCKDLTLVSRNLTKLKEIQTSIQSRHKHHVFRSATYNKETEELISYYSQAFSRINQDLNFSYSNLPVYLFNSSTSLLYCDSNSTPYYFDDALKDCKSYSSESVYDFSDRAQPNPIFTYFKHVALQTLKTNQYLDFREIEALTSMFDNDFNPPKLSPLIESILNWHLLCDVEDRNKNNGDYYKSIFSAYNYRETYKLQEAIQSSDLIVNATSNGLNENDSLLFPVDVLQSHHFVYDIVTHDTPFRRAAAARGCTTDKGLSMLLWQGAIAFNHWFATLPPIAPMREALEHL